MMPLISEKLLIQEPGSIWCNVIFNIFLWLTQLWSCISRLKYLCDLCNSLVDVFQSAGEGLRIRYLKSVPSREIYVYIPALFEMLQLRCKKSVSSFMLNMFSVVFVSRLEADWLQAPRLQLQLLGVSSSQLHCAQLGERNIETSSGF